MTLRYKTGGNGSYKPSETHHNEILEDTGDDSAQDRLPDTETERQQRCGGLPPVDSEEDGAPQTDKVEVLPLSPAWIMKN